VATDVLEDDDIQVDEHGDRFKVLRSKPRLDKDVAYYAFDKDAEDHARRVSYLNEVGPIGILEKRMQGDRLKSQVSRSEYEYALFCKENPWYMTGVHAPADRPRWQVIALAFGFGVVLVGILYASIARPSPDRRPPQAAPEAPPAALEQQGRVADASPPEPNAK
jgi:hypothetical protein